MKKLLMLGFFLILTSMQAHADQAPIMERLVACSTEDAMSTYVKKVWIEKISPQKVFDDLNKKETICRVQKMVFMPVRLAEILKSTMYTFRIIEIKTSVVFIPMGYGLSQLLALEETRFVMYYAPIETGDA